MIIKSNFNDVDFVMSTVASVLNDRNLQEENKNVVVWVKDGIVRFVAHSGIVIGISTLTCELSGVTSGEEVFVQLRAKDIIDILGSLKGLKRTKVDLVEFNIKDNEAQIHIHESAIDSNVENADKFNQVSKYRITKSKIKEIIKSGIQKVNLDVEGTSIEVENFLVFVNALLPLVAKEVRDASKFVMFGEEYYYAVLNTYVTLMPNKLSQEFKGFRLSNSDLAFLKSFVASGGSFVFNKEEKGNGLVYLVVKNEVGSVARIECSDLSRAFDVTNFISIPSNGVAIDKMYLIDVLKRINTGSDTVFIEVKVESGEGSFKVISKSMKQELPVNRAKGSGEYNFTIKTDLLASVVFSHATYFDDGVFLYFDKGEKGNIIMACADNSRLWHTKMTGLSQSKVDFDWS